MKQTKLMQVVILPTKEASVLTLHNNTLILNYSKELFNSKTANHQHLYIVSDNEIKEGDWHLEQTGLGWLSPIQTTKEHLANKQYIDRCKKIEATTDSSLKYQTTTQIEQVNGKPQEWSIPQIPPSFIEAYVKAEGKITEVLVEMEEYADVRPNKIRSLYRIKTRPDNTIIIHPSKTYTRLDMERIYCIGILNQDNLTMDMLEEQFKANPSIKEKFNNAIDWIDNNFLTP